MTCNVITTLDFMKLDLSPLYYKVVKFNNIIRTILIYYTISIENVSSCFLCIN